MKSILKLAGFLLAAVAFKLFEERHPALHDFIHSEGATYFCVLFFAFLLISSLIFKWRNRRRAAQARRYLVVQQQQPVRQVVHYQRTITIQRQERGIYDD